MEIQKLFIIMETTTKEKQKVSTKVDGGHIIIVMDKSIMEYLQKMKFMGTVDIIFYQELSMREIGVVE